MFRYFLLCMTSWMISGHVIAQTDTTAVYDSLKILELKEVIVIAQRSLADKTTKPLATLDKYLEKARAVNMIKRGAYAWEPFLNGMGSERSVVTIDGMRIYSACTDKMDPVTSYVEITNLAKASVHSGPSGSAGGSAIAGSLDLVRNKSYFGEKNLRGLAFTGFEFNNLQKIAGAALAFSQPRIFTDIDFTYRGAANYKGGGKEEILYSQFTKYNLSAIAGYKIDEHQHVEASLIYDHAVDIGYPALTMDVSLAKAFIGSVEYVRHHISPFMQLWKTKLYYNHVTHVMDDSKRPEVPVRMDMPGWSKTAGFYSGIQGGEGKHVWKLNLSGHHNRSLAEMTMHPGNPEEKNMFMLTWPGIHTNYLDGFGEDMYQLSERWKLIVGLGIGVHNNLVKNEFGLESLKIFYPELKKSKTRLLKRITASVLNEKDQWQYSLGVAYGERAPGISEGYGFYLFNSFDRFDYIGNPGMKNERSVSFNGMVSYKKNKFSAKLSANSFHIRNYIIGRPAKDLSVMTIGAAGVKIYEQLKYANIINLAVDLNVQLSSCWLWTNNVSYRRGIGDQVGDLPLIQPLTYGTGINYSKNSVSADISINGAARQSRFNAEFGEKALPDYMVLHCSVSKRFSIAQQSLLVKTGAENLLDKKYTSFADWNRLPAMGRNIFVHLIWSF